MQNIEMKGHGRRHKAGTRSFFPEKQQSWRWPFNFNVTAVNLLFILAFFIQMQYSEADTKRPILIDSTFSQPTRLQLRFRPMGKYAASTYTSHIRIPFNYSSLMDLQNKMNTCLDNFLPDLLHWHFHLDNETTAMYESIFKLYKQNTDDIFKLFKDLLESLPHVHERQRRHWDIVAMGTAAAALSLAVQHGADLQAGNGDRSSASKNGPVDRHLQASRESHAQVGQHG
jgi:hypothetical protein